MGISASANEDRVTTIRTSNIDKAVAALHFQRAHCTRLVSRHSEWGLRAGKNVFVPSNCSIAEMEATTRAWRRTA